MIGSILAVLGVIVGVMMLLRGGRYQRLAALILMGEGAGVHVIRFLGRTLAGHPLIRDTAYFNRFEALHAATLLGFAWLASRCREPWAFAYVLFEACLLAVLDLCAQDPSRWTHLYPLVALANLAKIGALVFGLLKYNLAPPRPVPGQESFERLRAGQTAVETG